MKEHYESQYKTLVNKLLVSQISGNNATGSDAKPNAEPAEASPKKEGMADPLGGLAADPFLGLQAPSLSSSAGN